MEKCSKCGEKTVLMSGLVQANADQEPYEEGIIEDAEVSECEVYVSFQFCVSCNDMNEETLAKA